MQKIETPKGKERYFNIRGSREKILLRSEFKRGKFISFSDLILSPRREVTRLARRMGKNRKKLK
jgi:hypothetical protein